IAGLTDAIQQNRIDQVCFETLAQNESAIALPTRLESAERLLQQTKRHAGDLQARYKELTEMREATMARIQEQLAAQ
ncbi:hypothetical protein BJ085DRAFT_37453, partial [Dimargaris cristalligena]